jgi:hypothetical protein
LFLAALGTAGAIVGVMRSTPVLLVCEVCILLALHRSKILRGQGKFFEVTTYLIVFLVSTPLLLGLGIWVKQPARENSPVASGGKPSTNAPSASVPAAASTSPIPPPGGFFHLPPSIPGAASPAPNPVPPEPTAPEPPANSVEAALMKEMRQRLTRDAGDPQKISEDVQWMRAQFEEGWAQEPPEQARKHREETELTARLILAVSSNRAAVLGLVPHISIDK